MIFYPLDPRIFADPDPGSRILSTGLYHVTSVASRIVDSLDKSKPSLSVLSVVFPEVRLANDIRGFGTRFLSFVDFPRELLPPRFTSSVEMILRGTVFLDSGQTKLGCRFPDSCRIPDFL